MTSAGDIATLYKERRKSRSPGLRMAEEIRNAYNGDLALPTTELPVYGRNEKAAVANLLQLGIDQTAMRVASTMPSIYSPPRRPGIKQSEDRAAKRRKAAYGWWYDNDWEIKQARKARYMISYASAPVLIRPWKSKGIPLWRSINPLSAYPAPTTDPDDMEPPDFIHVFRRSLRWLRDNYPVQATMLYKGREPKPDDLFDILEYVDADEHVLVALGRDKDQGLWNVGDTIYGTEPQMELERFPNRAGICTAVVPGRITLDRPLGQFDGALGIFIKQARLAALEEIAIERGVFPEQWLVSDGGGTAQIITPADPARGDIGEVRGGKIETVAYMPGYKTDQAIDRNERYIRVEGRVPAEYTGESSSNVRTARRGNEILTAAVDFTIGEAQKILARSEEKALARGIAVAKAYFGGQRKQFYVGWDKSGAPVDYVPNEDFDSDVCFVRYSLPGTDINGLAVSMGQRMGLGIMSKRTGMELDPMVDDPELEHDRVVDEQLEQAVLGSLQQGAASGQIPPTDIARITELVGTHKMTLVDAVKQVQQEAQQRQSTTENPVQPGSPESMPGMAQPGAGAEAGVAQPPNMPSSADLEARLRSIGQTNRAIHNAGTTPSVTPVAAA